MHRTAINIVDSVFQQARIKALWENVSISEVVRDLLASWVAGEIDLTPEGLAHQRLVHLAHEAQGMWADRDADAYLAASRAGLDQRDTRLPSIGF